MLIWPNHCGFGTESRQFEIESRHFRFTVVSRVGGGQNSVCYRTGIPTLGRAQFRKPKRLRSFEKLRKTATLWRIRAPWALGPAIWATRPPAARQNTVLSERPWLLSRARGGVRLGNAQHYRGIDVTDGVRGGNLRHIRRCSLANSQHSRGFGVPTRGRAGDLHWVY